MSKFKGLLDAARGLEPEKLPENSTQEEEVIKEPVPTTKPVNELEVEQKRGRPKGKRSHPDYEQVTAYIRKETHTAAKIALLEDGQNGQKREFSELIQELLEQWLKSRT